MPGSGVATRLGTEPANRGPGREPGARPAATVAWAEPSAPVLRRPGLASTAPAAARPTSVRKLSPPLLAHGPAVAHRESGAPTFEAPGRSPSRPRAAPAPSPPGSCGRGPRAAAARSAPARASDSVDPATVGRIRPSHAPDHVLRFLRRSADTNRSPRILVLSFRLDAPGVQRMRERSRRVPPQPMNWRQSSSLDATNLVTHGGSHQNPAITFPGRRCYTVERNAPGGVCRRVVLDG